jgi:hypothetical protein
MCESERGTWGAKALGAGSAQLNWSGAMDDDFSRGLGHFMYFVLIFLGMIAAFTGKIAIWGVAIAHWIPIEYQ